MARNFDFYGYNVYQHTSNGKGFIGEFSQLALATSAIKNHAARYWELKQFATRDCFGEISRVEWFRDGMVEFSAIRIDSLVRM